MGNTGNCHYCHQPLLPGQRSDARYCSGRCRVAAYRDRDRSRDHMYSAQDNAEADAALAALTRQLPEELQQLDAARREEALRLAQCIDDLEARGLIELPDAYQNALTYYRSAHDRYNTAMRNAFDAAVSAADDARPYDSDAFPLG